MPSNPKNWTMWIERAKQSLNFLKIPYPESYDLNYEDLCFHAQQSAEKALKGFLVYFNVEPIKTHNLDILLKELSKYIVLDDKLFDVQNLSDYAVKFRYPDDYIQISVDEYNKSFEIANYCLTWVIDQIKKLEEK
ncbi:MAG: HEPN domain-containing protein [Deltaproteobacteria bacterium]|jgi:HEPN domain-containing protein|nr:HEPN domain-containing protein [Deltaproteobacteria bacterium]